MKVFAEDSWWGVIFDNCHGLNSVLLPYTLSRKKKQAIAKALEGRYWNWKYMRFMGYSCKRMRISGDIIPK